MMEFLALAKRKIVKRLSALARAVVMLVEQPIPTIYRAITEPKFPFRFDDGYNTYGWKFTPGSRGFFVMDDGSLMYVEQGYFHCGISIINTKLEAKHELGLDTQEL